MNTRTNLHTAARLKVLSKSKTFKNYSYLAFSFIAIIIFAVFAIRPTIKNIISLEQSIQKKEQTLQKLKIKSQDLNQAITNFNAISGDTKLKLYNLLPDSTNLTCYLDFLNSIPSKSPIIFLGLQFQEFALHGVSNCTPSSTDLEQFKKNAVTQTTLSELSFSFNTSGNYTDLVNLIDSISYSNRLTSIQTVVFTKSSGNPLIMAINGKIFYYK
jgi:hypothetical protein